LYCGSHGHQFTVYPPGHVPYGREAVIRSADALDRLHEEVDMSKRSILWLLASSLIASVAVARPSEEPASWSAQLTPLSDVERIEMPAIDLAPVLAEDREREAMGLPMRFAVPIAVAHSPLFDGTWEWLGEDRLVWRLRVLSAGARTLNFGFTRYSMPSGGRLFLYSADGTYVVGPFTERDNEVHGQLWTPVVRGEEVVIEVDVPVESEPDLELELTSVNHDYYGLGLPRAEKSGSCNVDVACPAADPYRDNIVRSVAAIQRNGFLLCSGFMVNNVRNDQTPYFMTANHCGVNSGNAATLVTYWNYENSTCRVGAASGGPGDGSLSQFNSGSTWIAGGSASDFTLVLLDDPPDPAFEVYWAGWDATDADPPSAIAIHHPQVEEKRISFENDPTSTTSYLGNTSPGNGTHIRVLDWDVGTTEGGSSGSPLFNPQGRVVGQLHGGFAACGNDLADWYGRFSVSWDAGGTPSARLEDWLDPDDTGATVLDGLGGSSIFTDGFESGDTSAWSLP
jgi:hypothetical protein